MARSWTVYCVPGLNDLVGIVNGIDTASFDPMNDLALEVPYRGSIPRKRKNKLALQRELGLEESEQVPLIGVVSRLVDQKGFDLVEAVLEQILQEEVQLVVLAPVIGIMSSCSAMLPLSGRPKLLAGLGLMTG